MRPISLRELPWSLLLYHERIDGHDVMRRGLALKAVETS